MGDKTSQGFDVIVVGSGASGGWVCKKLTEAGVKVALVDAGRPLAESEFIEHKPAFELQYRDRAPEVITRTRPIQKLFCDEFNYQWFASDIEEPYTIEAGMPFTWTGRLRVTGGRTVVWGRQSYRFSDLDFKAASRDGYGDDWPIGYKDLAPYYDQAEEYVGVTGLAENVPELPDGHFQPAMAFSCAETLFRNRVKEKLGWTVTIGRSANLTRPLNGRAPCHYCGPCHHGCVTHSYFNSAFTTVADAKATGNLTHIPNAMVYKVLTNPGTGLATGVQYVDRNKRELNEVRARIVVLCAQALESVRILLNSANSQFPNGLANSSGVLGHYLMDHIWVGGGARGEFPDVPDKPRAGGPSRPNGIYIIRFRNTTNGPRWKNFLRGYGFQGAGRTDFDFKALGYGEAFKKAMMQPVNTLGMGGFGECLANWDNYVELDPNVRDVFGIPVLRVHMKFRENEHAMIDDMAVSGAEMLEAAGAKNINPFTVHDREPGRGIHEVGVARMGSDPKKSVLNPFQQTHDIRNLFVMDGSGFVSSACQNPTLTIMALALRSTEYLKGEMKRGNV